MKLNETGVWLGGLAGLLLTAAVTFSTFQYLNQIDHHTFEEQSLQADQQFRHYIEQVKESLRFTAVTLDMTDRPQNVQLLAEHKQTVIYAPLIKHTQRAAFIAHMQEDGFMTFSIRDGSQHTEIHPAYLPITRIEPFNVKNTFLLGIDLLNRKDIHNVIMNAAASSEITIAKLKLGEHSENYWMFKAIYTGFSAQGDRYFAKHKMEMLNGIVGYKLSFPELLTPTLLASGMRATLFLEKGGSSIMLEEKRLHPISSARLSKQFIYPIDASHHFQLSIEKPNIWSTQTLWILISVAMLGMMITWLLMRSSYVVIQSDQRRKNILESAFEGMLTFNEWGNILEANPSAHAMLDHLQNEGKKQLLQLFDLSQFPEIHRGNVGQYLLKNRKILLNQPIELLARDGTCIFECSIADFQISSKIQFTMFFRDVTARKNNEEERTKLATIVEQSFNGIILTDCEGCIRYVNPAFEMISGYSSDELLGKNPNIVKSNEHSKSYYEKMWQALAKGESWKGSFINKAKDGHLYEVEQTIFPIYSPKNKALIGYTSIQQDVTERNRMQKQDEHAQRLESLGVLAGGIAHDFNNLLTAIMGNASLAMRDLDSPDACKVKLNNIIHASESAANLCKQMLAYSGKGQFIVHPVNLSQVTDKITQLLQTSVNKKARLILDLDDKLPLIEADEGQMQQVIMNLVLNSAEAMDEDSGKIHVSTSTRHLSKQVLQSMLNGEDVVAGDYVGLHVDDNGCGMDQETQKKIFDPFFTTKFTGRGLGMSAILGIIRAHHGVLEMQSVVGKGTHFSVFFPIASDTADLNIAADAAAIYESKPESAMVLVVDDEKDIRDVASAILDAAGMQSMQADGGEQGLELLHKHLHDIDVILLDMTMPNMNGQQFYIKMQEFAAHIPVIVSSGYSEADIRQRFEEGSALNLEVVLGFLQKPYHPHVLQQKVQDLLTKR